MSRIQPLDLEKKYDVSFVLSGPEPQRTRLEKIILNQAKDLKYKMMLVQGKPELDEEQAINENLHIKSYMSGEELSSLMTSSELIVCRSGYSTIMDLVVLGKKALLIPTPGQTEQEFLADYYKEQGLAHFVTQAKLDLKNDIVQALEVKGFGIFDGSSNNLDKALEGFLEKIS
ncbi:MAG: glycosyltransferase [Bacteroidota bacterium]